MRRKTASAVLTVALLAMSILLLISELVRVGPGASFETPVSFAQLQSCRADADAAQDIVRHLRRLGALCRYDLGVERPLCTGEISVLEAQLAEFEFELNQQEKQGVRNDPYPQPQTRKDHGVRHRDGVEATGAHSPLSIRRHTRREEPYRRFPAGGRRSGDRSRPAGHLRPSASP